MVRILLADDRIVVRRGLRALLEPCHGFHVCAEACNGREAIELAVVTKPDVVILDLSLPIIDGIEATRRIRKQSPTTEVMIFAISNGESRFRDALDAGARGYILMSESDDQIVKAIEALARHRAFFSNHLSDTFADRGSGNHSTMLTTREREVVRLIAEGKSNKNIAHLLDISIKTVETHRSTLMKKLKVHSTAHLVRYAIRCGMILP